jgi:hypothetical protein
MDKSTRFDLMMEALTELVQDEQAPQTAPMPGLPTLKSVLADISPLPSEALFLGLAEDGLPVLLNLYDPVPGPILISADKDSGKTTLLKTIARAADLLHSPSEVQYGVITPYPDEWKKFHGNQNNAGIYFTQDDNARELLQSLVTWAHHNKGEEQSILLLIDDLEAITKLDEQAGQNLRWLLLRGPSRRIWPFITLNASRSHDLKDWLEFFRTRLFGHVENSDDAYLLIGNRNQTLDHLTAGTQFTLRENNELLVFSAPPID